MHTEIKYNTFILTAIINAIPTLDDPGFLYLSSLTRFPVFCLQTNLCTLQSQGRVLVEIKL